MRRPLLCFSLLSLMAVGCPAERPGPAQDGVDRERREENKLPVTQRSITVTVAPHEDVPEQAALVFLGFVEDQVEGNHPKKGKPPAFYWATESRSIEPSMTFDAPLPDDIHLLVVLDGDGDGRPAPDERSTAFLSGLEGETLALSIDRAFGDLGGPARGGPERDVVVDVSRVGDAVKGEVAPLILGYEADGLRNGMPRAGVVPAFLWAGEPTKFAETLAFRAPLPGTPGLDVILMLDTDGDGLPSPEEPLSPVVEDFTAPAEGTPWRVEVDRLFKPARADQRGPAGQESDLPGAGRSVRVMVDADPRVTVKQSSILFLGYEDVDVEGGKPMPDAHAAFQWRVLEPEFPWPMTVEARVPREGVFFVVVDMNGDAQASVGDLTTAALSAPDPKTLGDALNVVLDRTWAFADEAEDEGEGEE